MLRLLFRMFKFLFIGPAPKSVEAKPSPTTGVPSPAPSPVEGPQFAMEPANGWLIVQRMESESRSPGGIVIPDTSRELNVKVCVLATCKEWVNDHGHTQKSLYRAGDYLVISRYAGQQLILDHGQIKITMLRELEVLAKIRMSRHADHVPDAVCLPPEKVDATLEYQAEGRRREEYAINSNE